MIDQRGNEGESSFVDAAAAAATPTPGTRQRERALVGLVKLLSIPNYVVLRHGYEAAAVRPVTGGADDSSMVRKPSGAAEKGNKRERERQTDRKTAGETAE